MIGETYWEGKSVEATPSAPALDAIMEKEGLGAQLTLLHSLHRHKIVMLSRQSQYSSSHIGNLLAGRNLPRIDGRLEKLVQAMGATEDQVQGFAAALRRLRTQTVQPTKPGKPVTSAELAQAPKPVAMDDPWGEEQKAQIVAFGVQRFYKASDEAERDAASENTPRLTTPPTPRTRNRRLIAAVAAPAVAILLTSAAVWVHGRIHEQALGPQPAAAEPHDTFDDRPSPAGGSHPLTASTPTAPTRTTRPATDLQPTSTPTTAATTGAQPSPTPSSTTRQNPPEPQQYPQPYDIDPAASRSFPLRQR